MKRYWNPLTEPCGGCDGATEVYSFNEYLIVRPESCLPGDMVRCLSCYCQGWIDVDEDGAYVHWPHDICAKCHRIYEAKLERVTEGIIAWLKEQNT